jgi:hypothetical protein
VPDTVGNFAVFHNPAPYLDENRDEAMVVSSDSDRMSTLIWSCRGSRTRLDVLLDRYHGFSGLAAKLVHRFDRGRQDTIVVRLADDVGMRYALPASQVSAFTMQAIAASRLTVRAYTPGGLAREYVFDLTGAARALGSLPCAAAPRRPAVTRRASGSPAARRPGA